MKNSHRALLVTLAVICMGSVMMTRVQQAHAACTTPGPSGLLSDADCDNIADLFDNCPDVKNGNCASNIANCDIDEDGAINEGELAGGGQADFNHDRIGDACDDVDDDGITDAFDNCPQVTNADQSDTDNDGFGDACSDLDHDGRSGPDDNCPLQYNPTQQDLDNDGTGDLCDNCKFKSNPGQEDSSNNSVGDVCEGDQDSDGILDPIDNCLRTPNQGQLDADRDGRGDACDNCTNVPNPDQTDANSNNVGDACEGGPAGGPSIANPLNSPGIIDDHLQVQGSGGCGSSLLPGGTVSGGGSAFSFLLSFLLGGVGIAFGNRFIRRRWR